MKVGISKKIENGSDMIRYSKEAVEEGEKDKKCFIFGIGYSLNAFG